MARLDLHGKTAVVTGAGSGIGRALALGLAVRGFTDVLLHEPEGSTVVVSVVCPGGGVERRKPRILVGNDAKIGVCLERLMPIRHYSLMRGRLGE